MECYFNFRYYYGLGEEEQTTETSLGAYKETSGKWSASDMSLNLGYSYKVNSAMSLGITGKYIQQKISGYSADAFAMDIGLLTSYISDDVKIGLTIQNIGTKLKMIDKEFDLPIIYRAGISYKFVNWLFAADLVKASDNDVNIVTGIEYNFDKILKLRIGWKSNDDLSSSGISTGLGFTYNNLDVDYSFEPKDEFGDVHRVSLNYRF